MSDKKISQLTALTGANTASDDALVIVDTSATETKKISVTEIQQAPVASGTANGVAYLNGSKVLTTGSALTFNGTNLGIGTTAPGARLVVAGTGDTVIQSLRNTGNGGLSFTDHAGRISFGTTNGTTAYLGARIGIVADATWTAGTSHPSSIVFSNVPDASATLTERMRLNSSGNLGIGTSSPSDKLEIGGAGAGIILASPNGTRYRLTVSNLGVLTVAAV